MAGAQPAHRASTGERVRSAIIGVALPDSLLRYRSRGGNSIWSSQSISKITPDRVITTNKKPETIKIHPRTRSNDVEYRRTVGTSINGSSARLNIPTGKAIAEAYQSARSPTPSHEDGRESPSFCICRSIRAIEKRAKPNQEIKVIIKNKPKKV